MRLIRYLIYGFVSGFSELIPVSGQAHQYLLQYIFGMDTREPILDFLVHTAILAAIFVGNYPALARLRRDMRLQRKRRKMRSADMRGIYDIRISKTASFIMVIGLLTYTFVNKVQTNLVLLIFTSIISGAVLLLSDHMRQGNKDSNHFSVINAIVLGIAGAFSAIPGISRVGMTLSAATACGADKNNAYHWVLLISIPAIVVFMVLDLFTLFTVGVGTISFLIVLFYLLAAAAAFAGSYAAITFMRYLCVRIGFSGIAYYNIGVGIFAFVLYLIT